jgi:hypothetical protein
MEGKKERTLHNGPGLTGQKAQLQPPLARGRKVESRGYIYRTQDFNVLLGQGVHLPLSVRNIQIATAPVSNKRRVYRLLGTAQIPVRLETRHRQD